MNKIFAAAFCCVIAYNAVAMACDNKPVRCETYTIGNPDSQSSRTITRCR